MSGDTLEELLINEGWPITGKQLSDFIGEPISHIQNVNHLRKQLLDADMREYAFPLLSDRINKKLGEFNGPLIVQIIKQRNISYPKYGEKTHSDGLIKIQLSDGFSSIQALLLEPVSELSTETPPGTKICLTGKIPVENGMLLITRTNCKVLGGNVEKMIKKWNMENWQNNSVRSTESNAPKWVPFSKKLQQSFRPGNTTSKMFRANDIINGSCKRMNDEPGDDFNAARKAQIELIVENSAIKKFARSQLKPKLLSNCPSTSCNNDDKKDPLVKKKTYEDTNRRFGRDNKKDLSPVYRPSNPPTLFDFMQSKVPVSNDLEMEGAEIQGMDRPRRNRVNEKGFRNRQNPENSIGSRTIEISNSNRYQKYGKWCSEHEQNRGTAMCRDGFRLDVVNDEFPSNFTNDEFVSATNKELSAMRISSTGKAVINKETVFFGNKNHDCKQNTVYRSTDYQQRERQQHQSFDNQTNGKIPPVWKIGDKCLAPWSDGQFYGSTLLSMGPADMCTIEYDGYGNRSSVPVGVLLPFQNFESRK